MPPKRRPETFRAALESFTQSRDNVLVLRLRGVWREEDAAALSRDLVRLVAERCGALETDAAWAVVPVRFVEAGMGPGVCERGPGVDGHNGVRGKVRAEIH